MTIDGNDKMKSGAASKKRNWVEFGGVITESMQEPYLLKPGYQSYTTSDNAYDCHTMLKMTETLPSKLKRGVHLRRVTPIAAPVRSQLIDSLRQAILTGELAPGEKLVEASLCEAMNVSRTSLREALRQLEAEKLLTIVPFKGPTVAAITVEDAEYIYETRALLEGYAARRFARSRTPAELDAQARAIRSFEEAETNSDAMGRLRYSDEFHAVFIHGGRNPIVVDLLASLHGRVNYLRYRSMASPQRARQSLLEIRTMYDAFLTGDAARAEQATIEHVGHARDAAIRALKAMQLDTQQHSTQS